MDERTDNVRWNNGQMAGQMTVKHIYTYYVGSRGIGMSKSICTPISMRHLNPQLSYYYFRFMKTDVHDTGILLPVLILTYH